MTQKLFFLWVQIPIPNFSLFLYYSGAMVALVAMVLLLLLFVLLQFCGICMQVTFLCFFNFKSSPFLKAKIFYVNNETWNERNEIAKVKIFEFYKKFQSIHFVCFFTFHIFYIFSGAIIRKFRWKSFNWTEMLILYFMNSQNTK